MKRNKIKVKFEFELNDLYKPYSFFHCCQKKKKKEKY